MVHDKIKRRKKHYRPTRDNCVRSETDLTANNKSTTCTASVLCYSDDAGKNCFFVVLLSTAREDERRQPDLP